MGNRTDDLKGINERIKKSVDIEKLAGAWRHIEDTEEFMVKVRKLWITWRMK